MAFARASWGTPRFELKVFESSQSQALHELANGGKGHGEGPSDTAKRAALVP